MTTWILNSAVIPAGGYGTYEYCQATAAELTAAMEDGYISRVGYAETAEEIRRITGVMPAPSRELSDLQPGDVAYIVRLRHRLGAGEKTARRLARAGDWEIGRLRRLS